MVVRQNIKLLSGDSMTDLVCSKCGKKIEDEFVNGETVTCSCGFVTSIDYIRGFMDGVASVEEAKDVNKVDPYDLIDENDVKPDVNPKVKTDPLGHRVGGWSENGLASGWGELL